MFYGIAVFPAQAIADFAAPLRKRYDPHEFLIRPHLTVLEKQEWTHEQLNEAVAVLRSVAQASQPFPIHFNRFSSFYPASQVIYMALSDPEPLRALHQRIVAALPKPEAEKPYLYTPHLTVAQALGDDELHDVLASLKNQTLDLQCTVDRFALLRQEQNGTWKTVSEFVLS
ncbi:MULTISPECIES: 2'-5' RNA ligase family protein [Paenibacillus]|uniref:2'-5' RNA ligase family protein n=1 Tax=Paenibacillus TaxID=44249 RepID=UPI0022B8C05C|nr:2'-5' RNA ligase family protein [Paenibacillus caseinilyticus]MCZ8518834.1 2'-5' RNA ligase family protein [Paenibacillus caseinilyticus]